MSRKRKPSKRRSDRKQYGTDTIMQDKKSGLFFGVVSVHQGRVTKKLRGPDAMDVDAAREALNDGMYRGRIAS